MAFVEFDFIVIAAPADEALTPRVDKLALPFIAVLLLDRINREK